MVAVATFLVLIMVAIWLIVKGPGAPAALPFVDEPTTTESTDPVPDGSGEDSEPTTSLTTEPDDVPEGTTTTTTVPATTTTSTEPTTTQPSPAGTDAPGTSESEDPADTIAPGTPSSSTPDIPPLTVPEVPTTLETPSTEPAPTTQPGRQLVFSDEFDTFDAEVWAPENSTYGDGNNELQCYTHDQVSVVDGKLVLRAEAKTETCPNGSTREVISGMVRSRGVEFAPGQTIEFRVKLTPNDEANQGGLWPAFWSSGWAGAWPTGGEWDGLEVMTANNPARSVYSIHYANSAGEHAKTSKEIVGTENFSANWHVIRFDYGTNGELTWYLDGEVVSVVDSADTIQGYPAPFDQAMTELKINLALGGNPGPLDPRALPATFEVDYVRIYS